MPRKPTLPPFARRLCALRAAAGLTVYELAKRSGIGQSAIAKLERGESIPKWPTVEALAAALGVTPNDFTEP